MKLTRFGEFWAVLIVPWVLDIAGGRGILASLFGAVVWGVALVVAAVRGTTRNPRVRARQGLGLAFLGGAWGTYWVLAFAEVPRRHDAGSTSIVGLTWLHAGLLAAGLGMAFVLFISAFLWLLQDSRLRRSSWERRRLQLNFPSLESSSALCERALRGACAFWGLGLLLAFLTAALRWQLPMTGELGWWRDSRLWTTAALWLPLGLGLPLGRAFSRGQPWLYRSYVGLAICFLVGFSFFSLHSGPATTHLPLSWFVR